ncbi:hypothetical protein [Variovorax rhizosphaerae]|uniref:Class I SAM-dependent methyltransferase n=1 Tax=Variovorax rhizosphaerae TaxID=1836200 RepID=A0ABU8WDM4_9BURK
MSKKVLFVGAIDGKVELEFLTRMGIENCEVYLTSYLAGPELHTLAEKYDGKHTLHVKEGVDGTKLETRFKTRRFDAIAWLGPTNDDDKGATAALVQSFTQSAARVLKPGGVVYVLQDLRTPNFRPIVKIPGAYFLCEVSLEGRTVTQSATSTSKKVMEGRKDHLFGFKFDESAQPKDVNNVGNAQFEEILSMLMSSKSDMLKKGSYKQGQGAHSKKEISDLIFEFASR